MLPDESNTNTMSRLASLSSSDLLPLIRELEMPLETPLVSAPWETWKDWLVDDVATS